MDILVTNVIEFMTLSKSKQVAGFILACCIAQVPSLPLLAGFVVQKLLAVSLYQLARTEKGNYWKYGCAWHQLRTLRRDLGRRGWGDCWCFLTISSYCSHHLTVILWTRDQSNNTRRNATWLPGLKCIQVRDLALIGLPLGLNISDSDNNNDKNNDNNNCIKDIILDQVFARKISFQLLS